MIKIHRIQMITCFSQSGVWQFGGFVSVKMAVVTDSYATLARTHAAADAAYRRKPAVRGAP
jgi:hypothetical protein